MKNLDKQLEVWSERLQKDVKIKPEDTSKIATTIAKEVRWLTIEQKNEIRSASPVNIEKRYEELIAFQAWMDIANNSKIHPAVIRAQVIVQNYICFVYLNESCFRVLKKYLPDGSVSKKCCNFLINNPIRAFRNAIAHSNWSYKDDFTGIQYWSRKGSDPNEALQKFEVNDEELRFWQSLARVVAYSSYENLK